MGFNSVFKGLMHRT